MAAIADIYQHLCTGAKLLFKTNTWLIAWSNGGITDLLYGTVLLTERIYSTTYRITPQNGSRTVRSFVAFLFIFSIPQLQPLLLP